MICCLIWFGCVLVCEQSMYNFSYDYLVFSLRIVSRICMKYALFQLSQDICNA